MPEATCLRRTPPPEADGGGLKHRVLGNSDLMKALFVQFLNLDIEQNPYRLKPITENLLGRIDDLVGDEDIDLDAPLLPEDDD